MLDCSWKNKEQLYRVRYFQGGEFWMGTTFYSVVRGKGVMLFSWSMDSKETYIPDCNFGGCAHFEISFISVYLWQKMWMHHCKWNWNRAHVLPTFPLTTLQNVVPIQTHQKSCTLLIQPRKIVLTSKEKMEVVILWTERHQLLSLWIILSYT